MEKIYGNSEIVFSHLEERQAADSFKGDQAIYANAAEQESGGEQICPVDFHKSKRSDSLEDENRKLSVSLSSVEQRLAGTERKLEELQLRNRNASDTLSVYRAIDGCACLAGWKISQGKCYFFSTEKMNWSQSKAYCASKGAHLIIINNQQEQDFVWSSIREHHWIGLSDRDTEGDWVWVDGTPFNRSGTQFWRPNQPDNWMGAGDPSGEDCAGVGKYDENENWFDVPCGERNKFVCETPPQI